MSVSFSPIGPWPVVVVAALVVMVLTIWAYRRRLRGTRGRWRWLALGLRLAAVLLCVAAAFRPSVVVQEKKKQPSSIVFLIDDSASMQLNDEVRGQTRWGVALKTLSQARALTKDLDPDLDAKFFRFSDGLRDQKPGETAEALGRETAIGAALLEAIRRQSGTRVATLVLLSDGSNNAGLTPLVAARQLRSQQVPVVTVGFGSENAGPASRDIAVKELVAGPTVFVKNRLQVKGSLVVRGFSNQPIDVEMLVEGESVARTQVRAAEGREVVPITGLSFIPQSAGEKKITLRVAPKERELLRSNNEISTFVTVLKGGLNVLYLQGPNFTWEYRFLARAINASPDIQGDLKVLRNPATDGEPGLDDSEFTPGRYDVYILGDLPADRLTRTQQRLLALAVEKGAGLIMLGGRSSFGAGGWSGTDVARILPVKIDPGDGQIEPEGGLKFVPELNAPEGFIFQVAPTRAESARIWDAMPRITGTNQFGDPKPNASILAHTDGPRPVPLMVAMETGRGRVIAFGDETWTWARGTDEGRQAHRKFWRQAIFWLAHKEEQGENQVTIALDSRRISLGQKVEMTVTARDAKGAPITGLTYETKITREGAGAPAESVQLFNQGDEARGSYFAVGQPGEYRVSVKALRGGTEIGHDSARFLVYQDDREMENPAADRALLRQIAETTGGESLPPEQLPKYLRSLHGKVSTEFVSQTEHRIWDNWPFFLIFTALLTLEWWLRKRNGWV